MTSLKTCQLLKILLLIIFARWFVQHGTNWLGMRLQPSREFSMYTLKKKMPAFLARSGDFTGIGNIWTLTCTITFRELLSNWIFNWIKLDTELSWVKIQLDLTKILCVQLLGFPFLGLIAQHSETKSEWEYFDIQDSKFLTTLKLNSE